MTHTKAVKPMEPEPKYLLNVDGERKFYTLADAGVMWDNGFADVRMTNLVLEKDGCTVRDITKEEIREIQRIADEYSASK